jgi:glycosyltransferase involved in cell wall biosynthesis
MNVSDGAGYRTWVLLTRLAKDADVTVLSLYEDMYTRSVVAPLEESGLKIIPTRCQRRAISQQIHALQPDAMYLESWPLHMFVPKTRTILMIDFIAPPLLENVYLHKYPHGPAARVKAEAFSNASVIICASERLRYYLTGFLFSRGVQKTAGHIHVIPPTTLGETIPETPTASKPEDPMRILVAGCLNPWYDYETLFKAVSRLRDIDFQVLFVGDNPPTSSRTDVRGHINTLADKYGLTGRISITGFVPFKERLRYYRQADVGLNLATRGLEDELSTRARLLDYLWAGLPILTSGKDLISELAVENNEAVYFEPGDWEALSKLIVKVSRERAGVPNPNNRSKVVERLDYDFNRQVKRLLVLLGELTEIKHKRVILSQLAYYVFRLNRLLGRPRVRVPRLTKTHGRASHYSR